jgi:sulfoxide reductase heme-binding subunit YedZ
LLLLSLAVTPARRLLRWPALATYRRSLGLAAFGYACLHLSVYLVLDWAFDWRAILEDVAERPYVTAGATAFLCLVPLAATSTRGAQRRLGGRRWRILHRMAYVAAGVAVLHFLWLVKADLREPLLYAGVLAALLGARLLPRRG